MDEKSSEPAAYSRKQKVFYLDFSSNEQRIFGSEEVFINTPFGHAALFYHFIRTLLFVPIIAALCTLLWQPLLYLGGGKHYPPLIGGVKDFIGSSLWSIVMGFFLAISVWAILCTTIFFTPILFDIRIGFKMLHLQGMYLFALLPVQFFIGWLIFWKRVFCKLFRAISNG